MTDHERPQIGQFSQIAIWAIYYMPEPHHGPHSDLVASTHGSWDAVVVGLLTSDECHCGQGLHATAGLCPKLEVAARIERRREQERRPDEMVECAEFDVPRYLTTGARIREVIRQLGESTSVARSDG